MARETIVYVTREIERALGHTPGERYRIVTNRTLYGEYLHSKYPKFVTLITDTEKGGSAGTGDLMKHPETVKVIADIAAETGTAPHILVFKNTARIEPIAREQGWMLVNPPAATAELIENKVSQIRWLQELERHLPPHRLEFTKNIQHIGKPFILQWAHGHTGGGTILIRSEADLALLKEKFPERRARVTEFVDGPSFTLNVVVTKDRIIPSSVSYQITGLAPFTDGPFATVGNDWGLAARLLTDADYAWFADLTREIGTKMQKESWRGLFGVDVIRDAATGRMYLIEINARQPASTTYESQMQESQRTVGAKGVTTFEAHLAALLGQPVAEDLIPMTDGAQIVQRVTKATPQISDAAVAELKNSGFDTINYENTRENEDLLRIQSKGSILEAHGTLNSDGKKIASVMNRQ